MADKLTIDELIRLARDMPVAPPPPPVANGQNALLPDSVPIDDLDDLDGIDVETIEKLSKELIEWLSAPQVFPPEAIPAFRALLPAEPSDIAESVACSENCKQALPVAFDRQRATHKTVFEQVENMQHIAILLAIGVVLSVVWFVALR